MKKHFLSTVIMALASSSVFAQSPIPVGTIIPESLSLTLGIPNGANQALTNLNEVTFGGEFAGKAVMVVYHASW